MKKKLIIGTTSIGILLVISYFLVIKTIVGMTKDYKPYTFERVLGDEYLRERYGITTQKSPRDYGYEDVEEISFYSTLDSLKLSAWYIRSTSLSKSTVLLIHGRTSNRLKTMKYLQIFKETGMDTLYNFFIPDLRNSGKSTPASTYMGYKFAEDIYAGLHYLKSIKQDTFIIYAFSMGAMGTTTMIDRSDLPMEDILVSKLIFDSPLADVKATIYLSAKDMGLPNFIFETAYAKFSEQMNNYGDRLKMGIQLKDNKIPLLIIQSNDDQRTPAIFTKEQLELLDNKEKVKTWFMDGPEHVRIYTDSTFREEYTRMVEEFLRE